MPSTAILACPVCSGSSRVVAELPACETVAAMQRALDCATAPEERLPDYRLAACAQCGLEFAHPMVEPGVGFYEWLVGAGLVYPASRWEWNACLRDIRRRRVPGSAPSLLDVGCGSGKFIEVAAKHGGVNAMGIDLNRDVIAECRRRGFRASVGTLASWREERGERVDVISFWHVIEHIGDPVSTLLNARDMLSTSGAIYFSVPLTPMSYEGAWVDPFNLPPHHLTRWGVKSLEALSKRLGMSVELTMPRADSRWTRTLRSLVLASANRSTGRAPVAKARDLMACLWAKPSVLVAEWQRQGTRDCDENGRVLPDVALVRLALAG